MPNLLRRHRGDGRELAPLGEFQQLMDRFFNDPWRYEPFQTGASEWIPALDVSETEKEVQIQAEIPGMDPKDLNLSVSGDLLTISGEKKEEKETKEENLYHTERRFGAFRRTVRMPTSVEADKVDARYENGVLKITVPKKAEATSKRIQVKAGS